MTVYHYLSFLSSGQSPGLHRAQDAGGSWQEVVERDVIDSLSIAYQAACHHTIVRCLRLRGIYNLHSSRKIYVRFRLCGEPVPMDIG